MKKILIDLGCGNNKINKEGFNTIGIDISLNGVADIVCNLGFEKIPLNDNYADMATAIQLFEHIPRIVYKDNTLYNPFIVLMNEIYRIMKDGAILEVHVPIVNTKEFFQDPTHVNPIVDETWDYFDPKDQWDIKRIYGINSSFVVSNIERVSWYKIYKLVCVKNNDRMIVPYKMKKSVFAKFFNMLVLRSY